MQELSIALAIAGRLTNYHVDNPSKKPKETPSLLLVEAGDNRVSLARAKVGE